jgi:hypothetical protein
MTAYKYDPARRRQKTNAAFRRRLEELRSGIKKTKNNVYKQSVHIPSSNRRDDDEYLDTETPPVTPSKQGT